MESWNSGLRLPLSRVSTCILQLWRCKYVATNQTPATWYYCSGVGQYLLFLGCPWHSSFLSTLLHHVHYSWLTWHITRRVAYVDPTRQKILGGSMWILRLVDRLHSKLNTGKENLTGLLEILTGVKFMSWQSCYWGEWPEINCSKNNQRDCLGATTGLLKGENCPFSSWMKSWVVL